MSHWLIDLPMLMVGDGLHPESVEAVLDPGFTGVWICGCWSGTGVVLVPKATGAGLEFGTMGAALKTGPKGAGPVPGASGGRGVEPAWHWDRPGASTAGVGSFLILDNIVFFPRIIWLPYNILSNLSYLYQKILSSFSYHIYHTHTWSWSSLFMIPYFWICLFAKMYLKPPNQYFHSYSRNVQSNEKFVADMHIPSWVQTRWSSSFRLSL